MKPLKRYMMFGKENLWYGLDQWLFDKTVEDFIYHRLEQPNRDFMELVAMGFRHELYRSVHEAIKK